MALVIIMESSVRQYGLSHSPQGSFSHGSLSHSPQGSRSHSPQGGPSHSLRSPYSVDHVQPREARVLSHVDQLVYLCMCVYVYVVGRGVARKTLSQP